MMKAVCIAFLAMVPADGGQLATLRKVLHKKDDKVLVERDYEIQYEDDAEERLKEVREFWKSRRDLQMSMLPIPSPMPQSPEPTLPMAQSPEPTMPMAQSREPSVPVTSIPPKHSPSSMPSLSPEPTVTAPPTSAPTITPGPTISAPPTGSVSPSKLPTMVPTTLPPTNKAPASQHPTVAPATSVPTFNPTAQASTTPPVPTTAVETDRQDPPGSPTVTVIGTPTSGGNGRSLSIGAISGIVLASAVAVVLVGALVAWRRQRARDQESAGFPISV